MLQCSAVASELWPILACMHGADQRPDVIIYLQALGSKDQLRLFACIIACLHMLQQHVAKSLRGADHLWPAPRAPRAIIHTYAAVFLCVPDVTIKLQALGSVFEYLRPDVGGQNAAKLPSTKAAS
jgi:hypothetical protein